MRLQNMNGKWQEMKMSRIEKVEKGRFHLLQCRLQLPDMLVLCLLLILLLVQNLQIKRVKTMIQSRKLEAAPQS